MNLTTLFETQMKLDAAIVFKKGLEGRDVLAEKILALQTELGECANEWRGFKYWSEDQNPRTLVRTDCEACFGTGIGTKFLKNCTSCKGSGKWKTNPLLEEFVDCLHFILSIGLDLKLNIEDITVDSDYTTDDAVTTFSEMFDSVSVLKSNIRHSTRADLTFAYESMLNLFVGLGEKYLGFTWNQIKQAYYDKNKVNHTRQATGY